MPLGDALREFVRDGDVMTDTGFNCVCTPIQAYLELMGQGRKNLQMTGSPDSNQTCFIACGACSCSHCSYVGVEMRGTDRAFSDAARKGKTKVLSEWSHGSMAPAYKGAQPGAPGLFSKSLLGSDILKYNPHVRVMQNPMRSDPDPVAFDLAQMATGFELLNPEGDIPVTQKPSPGILEILRKDVDPRGVFTSMPGAWETHSIRKKQPAPPAVFFARRASLILENKIHQHGKGADDERGQDGRSEGADLPPPEDAPREVKDDPVDHDGEQTQRDDVQGQGEQEEERLDGDVEEAEDQGPDDDHRHRRHLESLQEIRGEEYPHRQDEPFFN